MLPSWTRSSTPVTVTVCATFQFAVVNVSEAGDTVPSVRSELVNPTVTFAVGWLVRTTVNVAVPPASVVASPDVGLTVIRTTSFSFYCYGDHRDLRSFPTRRSSDLGAVTML